MTAARRIARHRREVEVPELNVTPFMNLMIVLVPVLLLSLVFTHTTVIELDFPAEGTASDTARQHLEIRILDDQLVVADDKGILKRLPMIEGSHDYEGLSETLWMVKQSLPAKNNATVLLQSHTAYQSLVTVMDRIQARQLGDERVELFPNVSLGDVPEQERKT